MTSPLIGLGIMHASSIRQVQHMPLVEGVVFPSTKGCSKVNTL